MSEVKATPQSSTGKVQTKEPGKSTMEKVDICCPEFTPSRVQYFDEKSFTFTDKPFVQDKAYCFFYIPLNFGQAINRACRKVDKAGAALPDDEVIVLSDMISRWSTRIHVAVSKDNVPDAKVVKLSGTFLTKVFEGPYSKFGQWMKEMKDYVKKEKEVDMDKCETYAYYATCPRCAKKYGKNYTVLFVKVE